MPRGDGLHRGCEPIVSDANAIVDRLGQRDELVGIAVACDGGRPGLGDRRRESSAERQRCPELTRRARLGDPFRRRGLTFEGSAPGVAELGQLADRRADLAAVERE